MVISSVANDCVHFTLTLAPFSEAQLHCIVLYGLDKRQTNDGGGDDDRATRSRSFVMHVTTRASSLPHCFKTNRQTGIRLKNEIAFQQQRQEQKGKKDKKIKIRYPNVAKNSQTIRKEQLQMIARTHTHTHTHNKDFNLKKGQCKHDRNKGRLVLTNQSSHHAATTQQRNQTIDSK